jgi:hypothetical protein
MPQTMLQISEFSTTSALEAGFKSLHAADSALRGRGRRPATAPNPQLRPFRLLQTLARSLGRGSFLTLIGDRIEVAIRHWTSTVRPDLVW